MRYYCTYFDKNYLLKGLTLYKSLCKHAENFKLFVLCFDSPTFTILSKLGCSNLIPISLEEFEQGDTELTKVKSKRTQLEYYYTCTPSVPLFILKHFPDVLDITYLDADLFFYSNPKPIFDEFSKGSVLLIGLRHPKNWVKETEQYGNYNVGFLSFRNNSTGLACLEWWRERCIEWCYNRVEDGKFADQKYLDKWPDLFEQVVVLKYKGANLAFWNWMNFKISCREGKPYVDDQELIFSHLSRVRQINSFLFALNYDHPFKTPSIIRKCCFIPYIKSIKETEAWIKSEFKEMNLDYKDLRSTSNDWKHFIKSALRGNLVVSIGSITY